MLYFTFISSRARDLSGTLKRSPPMVEMTAKAGAIESEPSPWVERLVRSDATLVAAPWRRREHSAMPEDEPSRAGEHQSMKWNCRFVSLEDQQELESIAWFKWKEAAAMQV
ncbi:hypothetical protein A3841_04755 [Pontibacter flavimaris]|uniref:Uncharacterized protein n=1 Tax=Pontibacter flavimaris TaxID=1797110 RepID=A0A1Q5P9I1_9BACT|nr:hypothetical protein A3841_04755 [Pontibacter flavimaris]